LCEVCRLRNTTISAQTLAKSSDEDVATLGGRERDGWVVVLRIIEDFG
jgi:hypothetical protein